MLDLSSEQVWRVWWRITPDQTSERSWIDDHHACTCSRQFARLLWRLHSKIIRGSRVFTRDFIIPCLGWVGGKMWALLSPAGLSWIHGRWIGHPQESGNFTAPIVSADYCLDHRNQEPETLVERTMESRSSWAEEFIIVCHIIIITVVIIASWPYKPGVPCVFTAALPFYWLRALILIRLRECQKFRKNHLSNEIINVIYANQLRCQLIKTGVPPLESEEVHLFS